MASTALRSVIRHLHRLVGAGPAGGLADADLLQRFLSQRDEAAFEVLVWRHGPMVWNVCQRLLHHPHDTEDAFQATFLAFVRKAGSIRERTSLSSWLYKVAYRVALKAKARAARHARRETQGVELLPAKPVQPETVWRDLRPVLDDEVNRLPLKYRLPLVLCYLEGKTTDEAAQELGCPRGTVATRLAWARERLRRRLTRRGLAVSAGVLATSLSQNAASATLPAALVTATVRSGLLFMAGNAAAGVLSAEVVALAEGVLKAMAISKLKVAAAMLLAVGMLAAGAGVAVHEAQVAQEPEAKQAERPKAAVKEAGQPERDRGTQARSDRYGDPLPNGALARLGSLRWRIGISGYASPVEVLAFAPDANTVASVSRHGLWLFDKANGKLMKRIHFGDIFKWGFSPGPRFAFSSDGKRLACSCTVQVGTRMKSVVQIWELSSGRKLQEFDEAQHLQWLGWSADGQPLAVILGKGVILFHELATGKERRFQAENLPDIDNGLNCCAYAAGGKILAVPDQRSVIHVWDTSTGEKRCTLQAKGDSTGGLVFSPDGLSLASLSWEPASKAAVQLWDVATGKATHTVAADQKYFASVAFTPDSKTLATIGGSEVRLWDVAAGGERGRIVWGVPAGPEGGLRLRGGPLFGQPAVFSPDGKTLVTTEQYSGAIHVWDVAAGVLKPEYPGHTKEPWLIAFSPDGRRVASGGPFRDGTIYVWDTATGESLARVRQEAWVRGCAFSADGRSLFSFWTDGGLVICDAASGQQLHNVNLDDPDSPGTQQLGAGMSLSNDSKTLIALGQSTKNGEILLTAWDTATRKTLFRRKFERLGIAAVSADARVLATVSEEMVPAKGPKQISGPGPIRLQDLATGEHLLTFPVLEWTQPLALSPDGRLLATTTSAENVHTLRLWEVATAAELVALPTVNDPRIAFCADSRVLAMPAPAQEILLWDVRRGKELRRIKGFGADVTSLAFSPDGGRLASGLSDSTLLVWDVAATRKAGKPGGLEAVDPAQAWFDLGADAPKAFAARAALAESPEKTVSLLKERMKPVQAVDVRRLRRLLADLDSDRFAVREEARKGLEEMGELAVEAMRQTLADKPTLEVRQRIEALLGKLRGPITRPEMLRGLRAVAVLEDIATPGARQVLETLAKGAPEARLTQEAKASLNRLARQRTTGP
jgi:RNA polymerase sigma factor (sigma-70 family)